MPNRLIKESICTSDNLDPLSADEERFFYRLIVNCDDYGRADARPLILRAKCFPLKADSITPEQIESWLSALVSARLVLLYKVDGRPYLQMTTWQKHQQIRAKKSKFPAPDSKNTKLITSDINGNQPQANVPVLVLVLEDEDEDEDENARAREDVVVVVDNPVVTTEQDTSPGFGDIVTTFNKNIHPITPVETQKLEAWLDDGLEPALIVYAIEKAALAGTRTASYINGILLNLHSEGITTRAQAEARERDRIQQKRRRKPLGPDQQPRAPTASVPVVTPEEEAKSAELRKLIADLEKGMTMPL